MIVFNNRYIILHIFAYFCIFLQIFANFCKSLHTLHIFAYFKLYTIKSFILLLRFNISEIKIYIIKQSIAYLAYFCILLHIFFFFFFIFFFFILFFFFFICSYYILFLLFFFTLRSSYLL